MKKLSTILDYILFSFAISFIAFSVSYAFSKSFVFCFVVSATVFISFSIVYFAIFYKNAEKSKLSQKTKSETEKLKVYLLISKKSDIEELFSKAFDECAIPKQYGFELQNEEAFFFFDGILTEEFFFNSIKSSQKDSIKFFCVEYSPKIEEYVNIFDDKAIEILNVEKIYCFLKEKSLLPNLPSVSIKSQNKLSLLFQSAFSRVKCKRYLLTSLFFAAFSFISPYKALYLVFSAVLSLFSFAVLFLKKSK